jgi:ABC-type branched-subunit amino acid transport system substrate-binding protein
MKLRLVAPVAAAAAACLVFSGCSSHSGSNSGSNGSTAKGSSINVMLSTALTGSNSPMPETQGGLQASVAEINHAGGIDGHPIDMAICDTQGNANLAESCAQQAVVNKDVAVFAPGNVLTSGMIPTLQKAGIALFGSDSNTALDATSSISFPAVTGGYDLNNASGPIAKQLGCKKVATLIIQAPDITTVIANGYQQMFQALGIPYAGPTYSPTSETNFSGTLAALQASGADCVTTALAIAQTTGLLTAWKQSGSTLKLIIPGTTIAPLTSLSSIDTGIIVYSPVRLPSDPLAAPTVAAINKYASGTVISSRSIEAYAIGQLFASALEKAKPATYTAATVLAALNTDLRNTASGNILPPYSSVPSTVANQQRIFSKGVVAYDVNGTSTKTVTPTWVTIPGISTPLGAS